MFEKAYEDYAREMDTRPDVIFIKVGHSSDKLESVCNKMGVAPNAFEFRGDYYALPNVIPLLTRPSVTDLVMEILEYPLPERKNR